MTPESAPVARLLTTAVAAGVGPFIRKIRVTLVKKGYMKASTTIGRTLQIQGPHRTGFTTLEGLDDLPPGCSYSQIRRAIDSAAFRAFATQLIAVHALDAPEHHRKRVFDGVTQKIMDFTGLSLTLQMATYLEKFHSTLDVACADLAKQLRNEAPDAGEDIYQWALTQLSHAMLDSIERHLSAVGRNHRPTVSEFLTWLTGYQEEFERIHSEITLFDIGPKRRVAADDIFVKPTFASPSNPENGLRRAGIRYEEVVEFDQFLDNIDRTVILGNPGAGKSTAMSILSVLWSKRHGAPFYLRAREIRFDESGFNLVQEIERTLSSTYQRRPPEGLVEELLLNGSAFVVLDGIDEIPTVHRRRQAARVIESAQRLFPLCRFAITARLVGYSAVQVDSNVFTELRIQPFRLDQVRTYAEGWFALSSAQSGTPPRELVADFMRQSNSIHDLRTNPLMLALICVLYRGYRDIPRRRPEIYRRCIELLIRDWDLSRGISVKPWEIAMYEFTLSTIAHTMMSSNDYRRGMKRGDLVAHAVETLLSEAIPHRLEAVRVANEILDFCADRGWIFTKMGLDEHGNDIYAFTHQSFHEYFAAHRIARSVDSAAELAEQVFRIIRSGEGEVLAQIALMMYGERHKLGASNAMLALLDLISTLSGEEAASAMEFAIAAADTVMLNDVALRQVLSDSLKTRTSKTVLRTIFVPDFRYSEAVEDLLVEILAALPTEEVANLTRLNGWVWDVAVQSGACPIEQLDEHLQEGVGKTLERLISGSWSNFSDRDPACAAISTLDAIADENADLRRKVSAIRLLRWLGRQIADPYQLQNILDNQTASRRLRQDVLNVDDLAGRVLARCLGHGSEALLGALCLVLLICEVVLDNHRFTSHSGLAARLTRARTTRDASIVNEIGRFLPPEAEEFLKEWCEQKVSLIHYDIVLDTAVS